MQPTAFIASWKRVVGFLRNATQNSPNLAYVWNPNPGGSRSISRSSPDFALLDNNGDGQVTLDDDLYSPYYPGDEWVDWVGMSVRSFSY